MSTSWENLAGTVAITLDLKDPRLAAFEDLFLILGEKALEVSSWSYSPAGGSVISGTVNAWNSKATTLEFSWFQAGVAQGPQEVSRIALSKTVDLPAGILPSVMRISGLRQHAEAALSASGGMAVHTGWLSGQLELGNRFFGFRMTGYGSPFFELSLDFTAGGVSPPGLRDLAVPLGLMADPHADLQWLPASLQSAELISLTRLEARIEPEDPNKLSRLTVELSFGLDTLTGKPRTWPVLPGFDFLEIGNLSATLEVEHPLESDYRFPRLTVRGTVQLDKVWKDELSGQEADAHIDLSARWPDLGVSGELRRTEKILLTRLLRRVGVDPAGLPQEANALAISDLGFLAEPTMDRKSFFLHAAVENAWTVELSPGHSLKITELSCRLRYQQGETPALQPGFSGTVSLGNVALRLSAERQNGGWSFDGSTGAGQAMTAGVWIQKLAHLFGDIPVPTVVEAAVMENLSVSFHTGTRNFHFEIGLKLPLGDTSGQGPELDVLLSLNLTRQGKEYLKEFSGRVTVGGQEFDLFFRESDRDSLLVACLRSAYGGTMKLADLLKAVGADASAVPDTLSLTLKSAMLAREVPGAKRTGGAARDPWTVFGVDIDGGLNLSNLPLVGGMLPANLTLGVEFQALYSSLEMPGGSDRISSVNTLLPPGAVPLPTGTAAQTPAIAKGVSLGAKLHLGTRVFDLSLPVSLGQTGIAQGAAAAANPNPAAGSGNVVAAGATPASPVSPKDQLKWFLLHQAFGPLHFERLGLGFDGTNVSLAVDASVEAGGLKLSLDGLGISSPLDKFSPTPRLRGIGIDYAGGPVEIGGSFLRRGEHDYSGTALIKGQGFTLNAIGAYNDEVPGQPSLFIYAVLDYPLGGPSFFFVTGLAAGFGFNRSLIMPDITGVEQFPLVSAATHGASLPATGKVMDELKKLEQFLPMDTGQYFLAVGVKFNSFKLIDSFALLAVSFGKRVEIDVLGISTVVVPTPPPASPGQAPAAGPAVPPLAKVTIALMARFLPDEGVLAVNARITPDSFILSPACHLSGGFAFHSWFKGSHEGDFVLSLGGYHPRFQAPAHYPQVPRLGFNWQVTPELVIKGSAYYALTPHALMAGGSLEATYQSGRLNAWFRAGAHFLISWQPYYYDARLYIDVGGSYDTGIGTLSLDVGADLHIWGPEFSGTAEVDIFVTTVHVSFGDSTTQRKNIEWQEFKQAFLPDSAEQTVSIALESGLVAAGDAAKKHLGTVNPQTLSLVTNSLIPVSRLPTDPAGTPEGKLGVAPCGFKPGELKTTHKVSVSMATGTKVKEVTEEFRCEAVLKSLPAALWGEPAPANSPPLLNPADKFVTAISGVRLRPKSPPKAHASKVVSSADLAYDPESSKVPHQFSVSALSARAWPLAGERTIGGTILTDAAATARYSRILAMDLDPREVSLASLSDSVFTASPQLAAHSAISH